MVKFVFSWQSGLLSVSQYFWKLTRELAATFWHDFSSAFSWKEWRDCFTVLKKQSVRQFGWNATRIVPQLVVFYMVLAPIVSMPFFNLLLFHPTRTGPYHIETIQGIKKENVDFKSADGTRLHAWYFAVPDSVATVLISHGNGGNLSYRIPLIEMFIHNKLSVLAYDYHGYGYSEGSPSVENVCMDGVAAYDYLIERKKESPRRIILFGESLGGGVACQIAAQRSCAAIILQSTFSSLVSCGQRKMAMLRLYPRWLFPANVLDNAAVLRADHAPVLIVHGQMDNLIPKEESEVLYAAASEPRKIVRLARAGHNDVYTTHIQEYASAVSEFVADVMKHPQAHQLSTTEGQVSL